MGNLGKRMTEARALVDGKENLSIEEAVALVKGNAKAKFDETIEIAMNLGVDTRHADQMVRGVVGLPNGTGKSVRVAVFDIRRLSLGEQHGHLESVQPLRAGAHDVHAAVRRLDEPQGGRQRMALCVSQRLRSLPAAAGPPAERSRSSPS